jgi:hypothetical protein
LARLWLKLAIVAHGRFGLNGQPIFAVGGGAGDSVDRIAPVNPFANE